jgi:hypothetical protein
VRLSAGEGDLVCTRRHPFFVVGDGWVRAADLRPGAVLQAKNGSTVTLTAAEDVRLELEAETFNFRVERAATYFVCLGGQSVLVHNGGPDDYNYDRVLYWLLQKKPNLRPGDTDGLSVWKTNSRAEVEKLLETRVKIDGRSPKDPHSFYTPEQLEAAGIKPEPTPGEGTLADAGFEHNSVRPTDAPDAKVPLTEEQMKLLEEKIGKAGDPTPVKPKDLKCG